MGDYHRQIKANQLENARIYGGNYGAYTNEEGKSWLQQQRDANPNFIQDSDQSQKVSSPSNKKNQTPTLQQVL